MRWSAPRTSARKARTELVPQSITATGRGGPLLIRLSGSGADGRLGRRRGEPASPGDDGRVGSSISPPPEEFSEGSRAPWCEPKDRAGAGRRLRPGFQV